MVKIIQLKAKTKLGQQRTHNHGDTFHVEEPSENSAPNGRIISSMKVNWSRWLMDDDEHFEVIKETEVS